MKRRILLVDASVYVFRAWHSMPDDVSDAEGYPANAVHGFARFLLELLERTRPSHVAIAFDEALDSSFRNEWFPAYKANRDPAPESLKRQFRRCREVCDALGLRHFAHARYEADDLIGSILVQARAGGLDGLIVSADKDLSQLLRGNDEQWDFARDQRWGVDGVYERYGARAECIADFLGLAGDSVDNIPGVPGIGAKTASALLDHFGSLDAVLQRVEEIPFLRLRGAKAHAARLKEHREMALLSRQLATIVTDADVPPGIDHYQPRPVAAQTLDDIFASVRLGPMSRRRAQTWLDSLATRADD